MNAGKAEILLKIQETLKEVLPLGGHAFLYGSQARFRLGYLDIVRQTQGRSGRLR